MYVGAAGLCNDGCPMRGGLTGSSGLCRSREDSPN